MPVSETFPDVQIDLLGRLEDGAAKACAKLTSYTCGDGAHAAELNGKFYDAVASVGSVTIKSLAASAGAFMLNGGVLAIDEEPVSRILSAVVEVVRREFDERGEVLDVSELPALLERVFVTYLFHEIRHTSQGLSLHGNVKELKSIAGPSVMAEYDALADRDAALAFSAIYAESDTRESLLATLREALFYSTQFFFRAFPVPENRPDKIARAMAVLFMAARLVDEKSSGIPEENSEFPLDSPLYVTLSACRRKLAIHRGEPFKTLIGFANDEEGVSALSSHICKGEMVAALALATEIMKKVEFETA
ncbi:hypothetical protein KZ813_10120 [Sphingomonas sp. RHCKR7]|uniref:hypothetical protein n=1 Tax=Sphingomonas folli TaxID=2862497 RepID=UPI001CA4E6A9|nr:hypothetical protein [Sphingomonas folli]MBW6527195.1 hypothetical protein [Sphingomonas folli]